MGSELSSIRVDTREVAALAELIERFGPRVLMAAARAVNHTGERMRTSQLRVVAKQAGIKYGDARRNTVFLRATPGNLSATLIVKGTHLPLRAFEARQTKKGAISAAPWNTRRIFPGTFFAGKLGGHVYVRKTKKRLPLHKLWGPAIPKELLKDQSRDHFYSTAPDMLAKRLEHELGRLLTR